MQTLFKSNLFSGGNKTLTGAKNFVSGGKKLGASIVGTAKNNIVNFSTTAKTLIPQKKDNDKKDGVRDWVNDRLRKNLKLVRDSLRNNIVNFSRAAKTFIPQKKQKKDDDKKNSFISNYTDFFGSKKTERTLRKSLKLVRDSLVSTFEIARHLKAAIIGVTDNLKTKVKGGGGGLFGGLGKLLSGLSGLVGIVGLLTNPFVLGILGLLAAGGIVALLSNDKIRGAVFGFLEEHAPKIVSFLWDAIKSLVGGLIEKIVPKWMRNPLGAITDEFTGGEEFTEKHKELDKRLKDAGMNTKGISEDRSKQQIRKSQHGRTEEQQKIFEEVEAERAGLKSKKKEMKGDIKSALSDIDDERTNSLERKALVDKIEGPNRLKDENKRLEVRKQLERYDNETARLKNKTREKIKSDANRSVEEGIEPDKKELREEPKLKSEGSDKRLVTKKDDAPKIDAPLSDIANLDLYPEPENLGPRVNLTPITFDQGSKTPDTQQSQQPMSTGAGANSPSGNAVTFYSSTNSDDSYTALNAKMTFNIV